MGRDLDNAGIGLVQKAKKVFDPTDEGSVIHQVCDGPEAFASCNLGIAIQGEFLALLISRLFSLRYLHLFALCLTSLLSDVINLIVLVALLLEYRCLSGFFDTRASNQSRKAHLCSPHVGGG